MNAKIAHIIHTINPLKSSDLYIAQPVTVESMRIASEFASQVNITVDLFSAHYPENRHLVPKFFKMVPDLDRSVLDLENFGNQLKLPLIKDILDRLYATTDAEYLIYTNVDISLMPNFYIEVNRLISEGYDAFSITRRTISTDYQRPQDLLQMYKQAGELHPGNDCFVFRRDAYPNYYLASGCIGTFRFGKLMLLNLFLHGTKFEIFRDRHLTFHLGNDRVWRRAEVKDFTEFNNRQMLDVLRYFAVDGLLPVHPAFNRLYAYFGDEIYSNASNRGKIARG